MTMLPQSQIRLLIVENDERTSTRLLEYFRSTNYTATVVGDVDTALQHLNRPPVYDFVLLALPLPGRSGFDLLEEAKDLPIDSSFLVISGRSDLADQLRAFRLGADDFVSKPIHLLELKTRMEVIIARRGAQPRSSTNEISIGDLTIDFAVNTCFRNGIRVPLTTKEFDLLGYLVQKRGCVISRTELREMVWGDPETICIRTIDRHVAKIRRKLQSSENDPAYLQTVQGRGYRFAASLSDA